MVKIKGLSKKLTSVFATLAISATALVGLSTAANAESPAAFPGTVVGPSLTTTLTKNPTGNQSGTFWYQWKNVDVADGADADALPDYTAATGYLTVDTCTGSNLGSDVLQVTIYESGTDLSSSSAPTTGMTQTTNTCGSSGKGKQIIADISAAKYYYIKIVVPKNGTYDFNAKFTESGTAPNAATSTYVELDRVTICHRTHATTNPYRMITVSASSIVGSAAAGSPVRGHGKHATDAKRYNPDLYGTFDSTKTYAPNAKLWGDIIPPFKDKSTGGIFPGLNWTWSDPADADTNAILDKTEFGNAAVTANSSSTVGQAAVDLCKGASGTLTSKQLFDLERKNGQKRSDILDELADTDQYEPDVYKEKGNLDKELPAKEGPKDVPTTGIDQSLAGKVWLDINRNGFQEDNEPYMANIQVTVAQGNSPNAMGRFTGFGTGAKFFENEFGANFATQFLDNAFNKLSPVINSVRSLFGMAITYTVYTDKNGSYLFVSLPAGEWNVTGVVPAGLEVTYDSFAGSDANVDATVPAGGFAFTWVGLVGPAGTGINAPILNPDGTPVTGEFVLTSSGNDAIFCNADDVNYLLTATDGKLVLSGIPNGSYYIRQIGNTSTIADFNVVLGETYSGTIKTVKGVRCSLLTGQQLAATGNGLGSLPGITLLLLVSGALAVFGAVKLERKFKN